MIESDPQADLPGVGEREIVIGVVAPVGGPVEPTLRALGAAFRQHGYGVEDVRISSLLDTAVETKTEDRGSSRLRRLMNKGDVFRSSLNDDAACAYLAAQAISRARQDATGSNRQHRIRHVSLIRSLKTPGEVRVLRQIYGERIVIVGVSASADERRSELERQLRAELSEGVSAEAAYLLDRDENDERERFGQRTSDAYELADAFVATRTQQSAATVERLVALLLGSPWHTPTRDEQGMFLAWSAKFRSSASGRQVGAAIVDEAGEVIATGCNDVPRPGGGQYWPDHEVDLRDFQLGRDANVHGKFGMARSILRDLSDAGWLSRERADMDPFRRAEAALSKTGPLGKSELADLIEYGRIVHAEMAALMTAARSGRAVENSCMYTTTYPCHECARLIIAAGIRQVFYIDPYPKSRAPELFENMFDDSQISGRVGVSPFQGVSPRLFPRVFELTNRAKDVRGNYSEWLDKRLQVVDEELSDSIPEQELAAGAYLLGRLAEAGMLGRDEGAQGGLTSREVDGLPESDQS